MTTTVTSSEASHPPVERQEAPRGETDAIVAELRSALRGEVIDPGHPDYDRARRVWNGLIDRSPAVIARCAGTADVVEAVRVAREHRPLVSVRGGGHQIAGSGVCDEGLVIDTSAMRAVHVDPTARTVRAQGGVTWGELDRETQLFGLATPGGEVSTTGIGGFTLGGGMGLVMRQHGLACDNLRSIEIVTADGMVRTASRHDHQDLFWAARGGGRGLGVVTSFEFDLHPLGPDVTAVQRFYPLSDAERILRGWSEVVHATPSSVTPQVLLWSVPPDPGIPAELHGTDAVVVLGMYAGPANEADAALAPLRGFGPAMFDLSGTVPYVELQSSVDELFPAGGRYYMKSHFMDELGDEAIATLLAWNARRPTPESLVAVRTLGGAVGDVGPEESAYPHRAARFNLSIDAGWTDPALDDQAIGWARDAWDAMRPFASGGVYVNFSGLGEEADDLRDAVYGDSQRRLDEVRAAYDPDGLFAAAARRP
jgi:FAD/FMN-containing dehydrogenase